MGNCFMITSNSKKNSGGKKTPVEEKKVNDAVDIDGKPKSGLHTPRSVSRKVSDVKIDADASTNQILLPKMNKDKEATTEAVSQMDVDIQIELDKKRKEKKKKKIISKENEDIFENIKKIERKKKENDIFLIIKCLRTHNVFFDLSENELENIVQQMFYCEVAKDEFIFKQGDNASCYFIIDEGQVDIIINQEVKRSLKKGEGFGELALLYGAPRSGSVRASEKCCFWAIDRSTFRKAVEEMTRKQVEENRKFLENVKFFNNLTDIQKDSIAGVLIFQKFKAEDFIVIEGDPASSFYVLKEGTVSVLKGKKVIRKMGKGDSFGEQALYYNTVRACSVKADTEVKCLALGRDIVNKILGDQMQAITFKNMMRWAFDKSHFLSKLTGMQVEKILELMEITSHKKGEKIFQKDQNLSKFVIVLDGGLEDENKEEVGPKGLIFGEDFMMTKTEKKFEVDVNFKSDSIIASAAIKKVLDCVGGSWENALKKHEKSHEKTLVHNQAEKKSPQKESANLKLEEFILIKKLGFGQFGSVFLVKNKVNNNFYALKSISKHMILEQSLEKHLHQEKNVLEVVNFPFIMNFERSFKDEFSIYFLVEYVRGMELFDAIREIGLLKTYDSQVYTGCLILALEFLHVRSIIYRDLKPENIMVDSKGFLKLIDMGTAKILSGKQGGRTFTIIGTPHYMAPEIITGKGYTYHVDLWSLGITLYEFLCGGVPFAEDLDDPYEIYEEIIKTNVCYPSFFRDKKAKKLIDQLLSKIPETRLGGSFASLKAHTWFQDFDWDKLYNKELKAPYIPPKEKMISEKEIKKMEAANKLVINEIKTDQKLNSKGKKHIEPKDKNWDSAF